MNTYDALVAWRRIVRNLNSSVTIVVLLGLAFGVSSGVFSVAYGMLFKALPYPDYAQLATLALSSRKMGMDLGWAIPYADRIERGATALTCIGAYRDDDVMLTDAQDRPLQLLGAVFIQPEALRCLGAHALVGRLLLDDDARAGAPESVVISERIWRGRFRADPAVVGTDVRIAGRTRRVVGVMPEEFSFPESDRSAWLPLAFSEKDLAADQIGSFRDLQMVGRIRTGHTLQDAQRELQSTIDGDLQLETMSYEIDLSVKVKPLREIWVGPRRFVLDSIVLAACLLMLVTVANVCNLFILRILARRHEDAVAAALGGTRWHAIRRMAVECFGLSLFGVVLSALVGPLVFTLLRRYDVFPSQTPQHIGADLATVAFTLAAGMVTTVCMVLSGMSAARYSMNQVLRQGSTQTPSRAARRVRELLVVSQLAITFALLVGTGLVVRSAQALLNEKTGFEPKGLVIGRLALLHADSQAALETNRESLRQFAEEVERLPGVGSLGMATSAPFGPNVSIGSFRPPGNDSFSLPGMYATFVSAQYLSAMSIPLKRGRTFTADETRAGAPVAIIDTDIAEKYFHQTDPIDQRITISATDTMPTIDVTIVGIVPAVRQRSLARKDEYPTIYRPRAIPFEVDALPLDEVELAVRVATTPNSIVRSLEAAGRRLAPQFQFLELRPMQERLEENVADLMRLDFLLRLLGLAVVLLAGVGLYAIVSFTVSTRWRELGIRQVVGAQPRRIMRDTLLEGGRLIALGVCCGAPLAAVLASRLATNLYRTSPYDPGVFGTVVVLFLAIGLAANWLPARRAAISDPMHSLRGD